MIHAASRQAIEDAARRLKAGELVAFPTETVYGLGADATSDAAVARIFAAKARPRFNPLIVHVTGLDAARAHVVGTPLAERLAAAYWPGPLTLVLARRAECRVSLLASAGLDTLAVRAPSHPVARALLDAFGGPVAAPSANRSGRVSATSAQHVAADFGASGPFILDGGPSPLGLESTVIDLTADPPALLRPGALERSEVERIAGPLAPPDAGALHSPGLLARHYAPAHPLRLGARKARADEALIAFGDNVPAGARLTLNLSPRGDLTEAAANLFAQLRAADAADVAAIAVMPIPETGLGEAINDRLRRAAHQ